MNRIFGTILCIFSLVGLVSSPALAAISCAMKCQEMQPAIESVQGADSMSQHCAEMAAAHAAAMSAAQADESPRGDNLVDDVNEIVGDLGCKCPTSCGLTAPAVLSHAEIALSQQAAGDIFIVGLRTVEESFRSRLFRPPIA